MGFQASPSTMAQSWPLDSQVAGRKDQVLLNAWDISSAKAQVLKAMLKAAGIQSDTTVRRSAVEQENLEQYLKSEKIGFLEVINKPSIYTFFKDHTSRNRTLPFILKYRNQIHESSSWHILDKVLDETFQQFGKQNYLKHLLKSSANKYYFTTTWI